MREKRIKSFTQRWKSATPFTISNQTGELVLWEVDMPGAPPQLVPIFRAQLMVGRTSPQSGDFSGRACMYMQVHIDMYEGIPL